VVEEEEEEEEEAEEEQPKKRAKQDSQPTTAAAAVAPARAAAAVPAAAVPVPAAAAAEAPTAARAPAANSLRDVEFWILPKGKLNERRQGFLNNTFIRIPPAACGCLIYIAAVDQRQSQRAQQDPLHQRQQSKILQDSCCEFRLYIPAVHPAVNPTIPLPL